MIVGAKKETHASRNYDAGVAINSEVLFSNCMGSASFALTLLEELESSGRRSVEAIAEHAAAANYAATAQAAHSIKGAAGIIGAEPLRSLAAKIELAGAAADVGSITRYIDDIRQEMERCLAQIPAIRMHNQAFTTYAANQSVQAQISEH